MADTSFHGWQAKMKISGQNIGVVNNWEVSKRRSNEFVHELGEYRAIDVKEGLEEITFRFEKAFITISGFDLLKANASGFLSAFTMSGALTAEASGNNKTLTVDGCKSEEWTWRAAKDGIIIENVVGKATGATLV